MTSLYLKEKIIIFKKKNTHDMNDNNFPHFLEKSREKKNAKRRKIRYSFYFLIRNVYCGK